MQKIYGVIKDHESATKFVSDLVSCLGLGGITSTVEGAQMKLRDAQIKAAGSEEALKYLGVNDLGSVTQAAAAIIRSDELRVPFNALENEQTATTPTQVIKIGDNLALIITERYVDENQTVTQRANVIIRKYRSSGGIRIQVDCPLIPDNSNWVADCLAYCICYPEAGEGVYDVLLKVATCTETPGTIERAFAGLHIGCYKPHENTLISEVGHTPTYFGAGGAVGGCLFAEMSESKQYGIVMFDKYHAPLFIWSSTGKFPTETEDGQTVWYTNNTEQSLSRLLGRVADYNSMGLPTPEFPEYNQAAIQMTALAPIFCPATGSDTAKNSKWMYMGIHDYSDFDASGHISIGAEPGSMKQVFYCDYGVCIQDVGNYISSGLAIPTVENASLQMYRRPNPPMMPHSANMIDYFDSKDGLSATGWMNVKDEDNDMIFVGSPTIMNDGSVRMRQSASPAYGYCNADWTGITLNVTEGSILYLVFRVNARTVAVGEGNVYEFPFFALTASDWNPTNWKILSWEYLNGKKQMDYLVDKTTPRIKLRTKATNDYSSGDSYEGLSDLIGQTVAVAIFPTNNTSTVSWRLKYSGGAVQGTFGRSDGRAYNGFSGVMSLGVNKSGTPPANNAWKWENAGGSITATAAYPSDGGSIDTDFFFYARGELGAGDGQLDYHSWETATIDTCLTWLRDRFIT